MLGHWTSWNNGDFGFLQFFFSLNACEIQLWSSVCRFVLILNQCPVYFEFSTFSQRKLGAIHQLFVECLYMVYPVWMFSFVEMLVILWTEWIFRPQKHFAHHKMHCFPLFIMIELDRQMLRFFLPLKITSKIHAALPLMLWLFLWCYVCFIGIITDFPWPNLFRFHWDFIKIPFQFKWLS